MSDDLSELKKRAATTLLTRIQELADATRDPSQVERLANAYRTVVEVTPEARKKSSDTTGMVV